MTGSIGPTCTHSNVFSGRVLTGRTTNPTQRPHHGPRSAHNDARHQLPTTTSQHHKQKTAHPTHAGHTRPHRVWVGGHSGAGHARHPSRTRKLSPPAPKVLHPHGCGRLGHRRPNPPPCPAPTHGAGHTHTPAKKLERQRGYGFRKSRADRTSQQFVAEHTGRRAHVQRLRSGTHRNAHVIGDTLFDFRGTAPPFHFRERTPLVRESRPRTGSNQLVRPTSTSGTRIR